MLALVIVFSITEFTLGTYTIFSTYLIANFDSNTNGTVVESRMWHSHARGGGKYRYNVEYNYSVENITYYGSLVSLERQSWPAGDRDIVEGIVDKYSTGKEVTVYYDSSKPEYSVLQPTGLSRNFVLQHLFFLFTIPVIVWFCSSIYANFF